MFVTFSVEHALSCSYGGVPSIPHNEIRDLTAHLMSEVCYNVGIEPELQPLTDERLNLILDLPMGKMVLDWM